MNKRKNTYRWFEAMLLQCSTMDAIRMNGRYFRVPMRKLYAILLSAIILPFIAACSGEQTIPEEQEVQIPIGFENGLIDNATRAVTALSDHTTTMGVWGWRSDSQITDEPLFLNHLVSYDTPAQAWTYSPLKYWEMHSTYRFYAYAPHSTTTSPATVAIDDATGLFTINGVTLSGSNIRTQASAAPSSSLVDTFDGLDDIDWMVDRQGRIAKGSTHMTVQFVMQHILSKLNIRVRANSALVNDASITSLVVDSITIDNFAAKGDFAQQLDHTPNIANATDMAATEWTLDNTAAPIKLVSAKNVATTADWTYTLESLVLPQDVLATQEVRVRYTMTFSDNRVEHYLYTMPLTEAFGPATPADGQFVSGNCYTLSFFIGPDVIRFDSGVANWDNQIDASRIVE